MWSHASAVPGLILIAMLSSLPAQIAFAGCCTLNKLTTEPETDIRVCTPGPSEECEELLFEGPLAPGEKQPVCSNSDYVLYWEFETEKNAFGATTRANCDNNEIEL